MSSASSLPTTTKFMRLTRTLGYAKVYAHRYAVNEEDVIELARAAAPIGWLADSGAWFCDHNECWIVDFEIGDRS